MPLVAVIGDKIFCTHGCLTPEMNDRMMIEQMQKPIKVDSTHVVYEFLTSKPDFIENFERDYKTSSYNCGENALMKFMNDNKYELFVQTHETKEKYQLYYNNKLLRICSSSIYNEGDNVVSILEVEKELQCSFFTIKMSN